jgi:hypothetical protein
MNDLDQIRLFRAHVEPPDADRVAAARARLLSAQYDHAPTTRRTRVRSRPALAALLGVPAVGAVVVALFAGALNGGGAGTADAAIIRHADAALAPPPNEILHTKLEGDGFVADWWQLTSPPYSFLGDKGPVNAAPEAAANATTVSYYDPATNTIHVAPSAKPVALNDPLAEVRQALQDGQARVLGTADIAGVATYEIQFADKNGFDSQSLISYVDQRTYRPIMLSDPQRNGTIVHLRVMAFDYLPATTENLRSLSLTARHPTARVVTDPAAGSAGTVK